VRALIDRFLEHGRAFHFLNGGNDEVYIGSADWMPRNFHRRVEAMFPIEDPAIRQRLVDIMQLQLSDNVKSWRLRSDGKYERVVPEAGAPLVRCQARFIDMSRDRIKAAEGAATGARFNALSNRTKLDGKSETPYRAKRDSRGPKKETV
jgi:polyphosphate kinase